MKALNQTGIATHEVARLLRLLEAGLAFALGLAAGFAFVTLGFAEITFAAGFAAALAVDLLAGFGAPRDFTAVAVDGFALGLDFVLAAVFLAGLPETA